ncbi:polyprenyl synthetase family protein [Thiospirochaeta perfilievii]|uniref:Polyprenyl synthetase family protein n=1 Tax=Thiospirochaeta perfilievii TaxID=252967 RepID=A0A5C1Q9Q0_9SPIO|nr:polyprenyl synthetase family protein [Thiospirochaeta perfilievii]QEN03516.1 polyprenyl synthetase family protein [Thiospirochaeta perfilievii]
MLDWFEDKTLNNQLNAIKDKLQKDLKSGNNYFNESLDYLLEDGGKMLRPILLLIGSRFGKLYKKKGDDLVDIATAIETLHVATLLHDDVIDEAKLRRGKESIQSKYSKEYAIYMGDYLLSKCFLLLTELNVPKELAIALAKVVSRICIGEILQFKNRYNMNTSLFGYLRVVSGKTAALFAISLSAGSYITKADDKTIKRLAHAGYQLGMAFQIVDDLLDFIGDEEEVGKDLRSDILKGYYCLPVIFALNDESEYKDSIREIFSCGIDENNIQQVILLIKKSGAIEKCRNLAIRYHDRALQVINRLPKNSGYDLLMELLPRLIDRVK